LSVSTGQVQVQILRLDPCGSSSFHLVPFSTLWLNRCLWFPVF
jgi:hypothetical protein